LAAVGQDQCWPLGSLIRIHCARHRLVEEPGLPVTIKALPRRLRPRRKDRRRWTAVRAETAERAPWESMRWMRRRSPGPSCPREFSAPRSHREHRHRPLGDRTWRGGPSPQLGMVQKRGVAAISVQPTGPSGPQRKTHPPQRDQRVARRAATHPAGLRHSPSPPGCLRPLHRRRCHGGCGGGNGEGAARERRHLAPQAETRLRPLMRR